MHHVVRVMVSIAVLCLWQAHAGHAQSSVMVQPIEEFTAGDWQGRAMAQPDRALGGWCEISSPVSQFSNYWLVLTITSTGAVFLDLVGPGFGVLGGTGTRSDDLLGGFGLRFPSQLPSLGAQTPVTVRLTVWAGQAGASEHTNFDYKGSISGISGKQTLHIQTRARDPVFDQVTIGATLQFYVDETKAMGFVTLNPSFSLIRPGTFLPSLGLSSSLAAAAWQRLKSCAEKHWNLSNRDLYNP